MDFKDKEKPSYQDSDTWKRNWDLGMTEEHNHEYQKCKVQLVPGDSVLSPQDKED